MPLTKNQKQKILEDLIEKLKKQKALFFVDFTGLKVKDFSELRKKIKSLGDEIKVIKKTLMDVAFKKLKLNIEPRKMKGEIALVLAYKDEILPAKTIYQFSKENEKLKILAGFLNGKLLDSDKVIELAQLPSKEELIGKLIFVGKSPISMIYNILQTNLNILKIKK